MKIKKDETITKAGENVINPYKGLLSYETADREHFYGRSEEAEELFHMVKLNLLTVVYGKAGIGKTSLLNAGLFPLLFNEDCLPIRVRLNYAREAPPLLEQIRMTFREELKKFDTKIKTHKENKQTRAFAPGETLWEYFHRVSHFGPSGITTLVPVLVFDQFEELFTIGKNHKDRDALIDELYWLIENQLPSFYKDKVLTDAKLKKISSFTAEPPDVRVVISLREDYLPNFMALKSPIISIDQNMFRVIHLNGTQARKIIRIGFQEEKLTNDILRLFHPSGVKADETVSDEKLEIEPAFLSLVCHQLFEKREQKLKTITREEQNKILEDHYDSVLKAFPGKVEKFIENKLLTEGGFKTPFRLAPEHSLKGHIDRLIDRRVIRKGYWGEEEYIEIIHDVLTPIISEKRNRRIKKEKNVMIASLSLFALFFFLLTIFAVYQWIRADILYKNTRELKVTTQSLVELRRDNTRAIRIAEAAYKMGLSGPQEHTSQNLAAAGYSSFEVPFYITSVRHNGPIYTAVFSPNGKFILTASDDGTAKVWNLKGECVTNLNKHKERIMSAVFSPKDRYILTASWDKTAKLWDLEGKLQANLTHKAPVYSAIFSTEGQLILTASRDGTAKLYNIETTKVKELKHNTAVASAVFSRDDKLILTASWDKTAKLWDQDGNLIKGLPHEGAVSSGVFSPDGSRIVTASWDKKARLWDLEGNCLQDFVHKDTVTSAVFSEDSKRIITASRDGMVYEWDLEGKQIAKLDKHTDEVLSVVFSPDGSRILTASRDKTTKLWDISGNILVDLKKFEGKVNSALFSTDGRRFLTACDDGTATLWTLESRLLVDLNKHKGDVNKAVFSPDGNKILTASSDHTAKLWDIEGNILKNFKHRDVVTSAVFSPDGKKILTASWDRTVKLWDLESNTKENTKVFRYKNLVSSAIFSPDGSQILTASVNGTVKVCDLKGKTLAELDEHTDMVTSAVFSPDGLCILTASNDGTAIVCTLKDLELIKLTHNGPISSAVFSHNGNLILTASKDGTAKLWDREGKFLKDLKHKKALSYAVFSPKDDRILTACEDDTAIVWTLESSEIVKLSHDGSVSCAEFSPDGRFIVTASEDGTAKLWDLKGNLLADLNKHKSAVTYAAFSPDGRRIITASRDGTAKVWYTPEAIYKWLKDSNIAQLSEEDKEKLGIK